jgi:mycobactin peptide synthetase MbtE
VLAWFADQPDSRLGELELTDAEERRRLLEDFGRGTALVLDDDLHPAPVGAVGDLYLTGGPLATAQWATTSSGPSRLVPNPSAGTADSWCYRSGDRARWLPDGRLEILGTPGPTGSAAVDVPVQPPATDTERALADLLTGLLDVDVVNRHDDFFTLGGDSILAVQMASRGRESGLTITARMIFENPVLADLAVAVDRRAGDEEAADTHHAPMTASGLSADELAELTASWVGADADGRP